MAKNIKVILQQIKKTMPQKAINCTFEVIFREHRTFTQFLGEVKFSLKNWKKDCTQFLWLNKTSVLSKYTDLSVTMTGIITAHAFLRFGRRLN